MEKAVTGKNHECFTGLLSATGQGRRKKKAEQKAGLSCAEETEVVGIKQLQGDETGQNNPRQIGNDAGNDHPEQLILSKHHLVEWGLNAYMTKCVWQGKRVDPSRKVMRVLQAKSAFSGATIGVDILVHWCALHKITVRQMHRF